MAIQGGGGSTAKKKKQSRPVQLVSEHGQGGGSGGNDSGVVPTPQNVQSVYGVPPSVLGAPAGNPGGGTGSGPLGTDTSNSAGGTGDTGTGNVGPVDWQALLGLYGLPQDVVDELNVIFQQAKGNLDQAIAIGRGYVRGTDWYAQTYPGIQSGINNGLFNDEQGYMAFKGQINQLYQQYYGRAATPNEVSQYATQGQTASHVAALFQADAIKGNLSDPLKGLFTDDELTAFSQEQAGIDTALGQKITTEANLYGQVSTLYKNFYGRDVTRSDLDTLTRAGTSPQDVAQQFATQEAINGMNPAIADLFTPEEIRQVALDAAGGTTQNGITLKNLMDLSAQLNPIYHQYTGSGVSREEVNQAYQSGTSADTIAKQFEGAAFINANKGDIQQEAGSFGDTGQFTQPELKALGEEQAGLDTPLGQLIQARLAKAQQRLQGAFNGTLAHPALSLVNGRLAGQGASTAPDVGA